MSVRYYGLYFGSVLGFGMSCKPLPSLNGSDTWVPVLRLVENGVIVGV